ncbi:MAG: amidohydrolase family protein [Gemmatimonadaceae bacterium]
MDEGVIVYVGPASSAPLANDYDLGDAVLLPGLVNAHTHLELTAMRGFLEGLKFSDWIDTLRRARGAVLDDAMLLDSARLGVIEGVECGVTTFADTSASGVSARAMRECGVRGITYQETFGPDPATCDAAMMELDARVRALTAEPTMLITIGVSPHAPYTVSDALYRAVAAYASSNELPIAMHIGEGADEHALVTSGTGIFAERLGRRGIRTPSRARSPIALLAELGALLPGALLIHAVHADDEDIRTIAQHHACVAHCPVSNAKLGHGVAPLAHFLAADIPVGLGSDSVASNNRMDMLDEARIALLMQNARGGSALEVSAQTALELVTIGGARALGLERTVGSLEPGKAADLVAFRLDESRTTPTEDPVAALIFSLGGSRAFLVTVAGRHLVENGDAVINPGGLRGRVGEYGRSLTEWRRSDGSSFRSAIPSSIQSTPGTPGTLDLAAP